VKIADIRSEEDIPSDPATLKPLFWNLLQQYQHLSQQNQLLRKDAFGRKSEKIEHDPNQQTILDELLAQLPAVQSQEQRDEDAVTVKSHQRRRKHPGRNAIPEDIPREKHIIATPEHDKTCPCCGGAKVVLETVTRTVVERIPATYVVHEYQRDKMVCPRCRDGVHVPELPVVSLVPKGLAGIKLLLFVLTSKYRYHLPLYRIQRQIYHESRIWFTRGTMAGWIAQVCVPLKRVYDAMCAEVKAGPYVHADESLLRLCPKAGGSHTSYMWVYLGASQRVAVFDYRDSRGSKAPREFLTGCAPGTYLMIDGYAAYDAAIAKHDLKAMLCMVHARREFVEAAEVGEQKNYALRIVRIIGQLYRIERFATQHAMSAQQRQQLRGKYSAAIMDKLKAALTQPGFAVLPQSRIGKAIHYVLGHWPRLLRFLDNGDLPIDNSPAERVIRHLAVGRKNWLFVTSEAGGKNMARLYSVQATCALLGIDLEQYLEDVLIRVSARPDDASVADLTPQEWLKARNGGNLPPPATIYPSTH
jgi:transposase